MEQDNEVKQVFRESDPGVKIAINFLSKPEVVVQSTISAFKNILVKMLEFQTAQHRETHDEAGTSIVFPLKEEELKQEWRDLSDEIQIDLESSALGTVESATMLEQIIEKRKAHVESRKNQLEETTGIHLSSSLLDTVETVTELEKIFDKRTADIKLRKAQLETITSVQLKKKFNDESYNNLIDQCNDGDEKIAKFFKLVANNDIKNVKRELTLNPTIAFEVNARMETVLHLAVSLGLYDMCEYILEQDCSQVILLAKDIAQRTAIDVARQGKQASVAILNLL